MNLFDFYIPEEIFVALSLIILFVILRRFFWKPVMKIIDTRQKNADDMIARAEEAEKTAAELELQRVRQEAELERQVVEKIKEARERAAREYDRIVSEAEEKAHGIVTAAEEKAKREYEQAMSEAREAIVTLALHAASAVVSTSMDSEKNRILIESMLSQAGSRHG
jgi:F-type H+-transporting ATPase subunit b